MNENTAGFVYTTDDAAAWIGEPDLFSHESLGYP